MFQDAARALGLLENTTEYEQCFSEAISYNCTPAQLHLLFCQLIIKGMAAQNMWQNYHEQLLADYTIKHGNMQGENEALTWITDFLEEHGIKITQTGLPQPPNHLSEITHIKLQYSNYKELITKQEEMINKLNSEQKTIYQKVINHIHANIPLTIFINSCVGRGKTFLVNIICITVRILKKITLPCATTGLAALNYNGGCTAHSLFHIPVERIDEEYKCQINLNSERAKLIQEALVIIWDELSMALKGNVEAVDMLLRELCNCNLPFGGKIFIRVGDF